MIRMSALNEASACGLSAAMADKTTNSAALMGTAFGAAVRAHFRPGDEEQEASANALGQLTADERDEVREKIARLIDVWSPPDSAVFELPIGLSRRGLAVEHGAPDAMTNGHMDCAWAEEDAAVVLDFKAGARAEWNVPIPRDNLQLGGYGVAWADKCGKSRVRLGLYLAEPGKWLWDTVDLDSPEGTALWERVRTAALRDPEEAVIGPHCSDCWVRLKCPTHLLPVVFTPERVSALEPLTAPAGLIEPRRLMRLLQACQAMEAIADKGKDFLRAYVKQNGPFVVDGKQWGPIEVKGREGTSVKALKDAGLYERAVAVGAVKQGPPTQQHRWTKKKDAA